MSSITISPWQRKPGLNPRYSIYDGRQSVATIFESCGLFSVISTNGDLIGVRQSLREAVDALCPMAEVSS